MTVVSDNALSDLFTIIIMIICVPNYYFSIKKKQQLRELLLGLEFDSIHGLARKGSKKTTALRTRF
jgi:hypothetical protein